jgi:hypothetical protein
MAAGVSDRLWEIGDIVKLIEANDPAPKPRGPYKMPATRRFLEPTQAAGL